MSSNRPTIKPKYKLKGKLRFEENLLSKKERGHTHNVRRTLKAKKRGGPRDFNFWYYKEFTASTPNANNRVPVSLPLAHHYVKICVAIGELMRLMDDHYPKVRPVKEADNNPYYCGMMSKEIQGLRFYDNETLIKMIQSNQVKGIGKMVANAICNNNVDFRPYDFGVADNTSIAFDYDQCMAHRTNKRYKRELTAADFKALPDVAPLPNPSAAPPAQQSESPPAFVPWNWLDRYQFGERKETVPLVNAFDTPKTKQEMYEVFLWRILFSETFLQKFSDCLFDGIDAADISRELENMRRILQIEILKVPEFQAFLQTPEAIAVKEHLLNRIRTFKFINQFEFKNAFPDLETALRKIQEDFECLSRVRNLCEKTSPQTSTTTNSSSSSSSAVAVATSHRKKRRVDEMINDDDQAYGVCEIKRTPAPLSQSEPPPVYQNALSLFCPKPIPSAPPRLLSTPQAVPLAPSSFDSAIDRAIDALSPPTNGVEEHAQPLKIPTASAELAMLGFYNNNNETIFDESVLIDTINTSTWTDDDLISRYKP